MKITKNKIKLYSAYTALTSVALYATYLIVLLTVFYLTK